MSESSDRRFRIHRLIEAQVPRKALRDRWNRLRYGPAAPQSDERIWIDPARVRGMYRRPPGARFKRRHSGLVAAGDWDRAVAPLSEAVKLVACERHFRGGLDWEETGIIDEIMRRIARDGSFDGCRSRAEVLARYDRIDAMYREIARTRRIEPQSTRPDALRGEHGGIFVHIDRDGLPILAGNGNHRLAIARILGLDLVPAHLGVLHRSAWDAGHLARLRDPGRDAGAGARRDRWQD